jgi:hypothetical protein
MKSKEEVVTDMCYTYRHDYGIDKDPKGPSWVAGMTKQEREMLYKTMEQIYDNNLAPVINHYQKLLDKNDGTA